MPLDRILPILVQFGVGGLLCVIGVAAGLRSGYLQPSHPEDRRALITVVLGFLGLLLLAAAFTFWLPYVPAAESLQ
jgi:hypothetical protein